MELSKWPKKTIALCHAPKKFWSIIFFFLGFITELTKWLKKTIAQTHSTQKILSIEEVLVNQVLVKRFFHGGVQVVKLEAFPVPLGFDQLYYTKQNLFEEYS